MIVEACYLAIVFIALGLLALSRIYSGKKRGHSRYKNDLLSRGISITLTSE